jgi:flagellar motor protein MotB
MEVEEDDPPGVPEWVVTYGDMMSLLLTFFIMLVSMSELKDEGKNRAALNSMREAFGPMGGTSGTPGRTFNSRSSNEFMSSKSENKKTGLEKGSIASAGGGGRQKSVETVNHGEIVTIGGSLEFGQFDAEVRNVKTADLQLIDDAEQELQRFDPALLELSESDLKSIADKNERERAKANLTRINELQQIIGQRESTEDNLQRLENLKEILAAIKKVPNRVVVRGHSFAEPVRRKPQFRDQHDLSFARARSVAKYLIENDIDPKRILVSAAGDAEPRIVTRNLEDRRHNRRVDVFTIDSYLAPPDPG